MSGATETDGNHKESQTKRVRDGTRGPSRKGSPPVEDCGFEVLVRTRIGVLLWFFYLFMYALFMSWNINKRARFRSPTSKREFKVEGKETGV